MAVQTFSNAVSSGLPEHDEMVRCAGSLPSHCSTVCCSDGYKPEAMLFVDENFAQHRVQRETCMSALSFRPVVRFSSSHYRYVQYNNMYKIVQVGIGHDETLGGLGFRQPPPREAAAGAALD